MRTKKPVKINTEGSHKAKIAFFDIETSPNIIYTWSTQHDKTDTIKIVKEWHILSFAVKYQGEKSVKVYGLPDFPGYSKDKDDDKALVKKLWDLFNDADILVAHYGDNFDIKKSNARFIAHGMTPPSPYKTIDTKKMFSSVAAFESNKLENLSKSLTRAPKMESGGFGVWEGCMAGDKKAWAQMKKYNAQDVVALEAVYDVIRPWAKSHPSTTVYSGVPDACPRCGGTHLQRRGYAYTARTAKPRLQCQSCGAWCTGNGSAKTGVTVS